MMKQLLLPSLIVLALTAIVGCNSDTGTDHNGNDSGRTKEMNTGSLRCSDVHEGRFKYEDPTLEDVVIERFNLIQTESGNGGRLGHRLKVNWINDCEYKLKYVAVADEKMGGLIGQTIHVKITKVEPDRYYYTTERDSFKNEYVMLRVLEEQKPTP